MGSRNPKRLRPPSLSIASQRMSLRGSLASTASETPKPELRLPLSTRSSSRLRRLTANIRCHLTHFPKKSNVSATKQQSQEAPDIGPACASAKSRTWTAEMTEQTQLDFRPEPALFSKQQAAMYLNVSPRTITNLLREGQLVRRKIGARTLIPKTSLENFLKRDHATGEHERPTKETE